MSMKNSVFVVCMLLLIWFMYVFVEEDYYICVKFGFVSVVFVEVRINVEKDFINKKIVEVRMVLQFIVWGLFFGFVVVVILFVIVYCVCMLIDLKFLGRYVFDEYKVDKVVLFFNVKI